MVHVVYLLSKLEQIHKRLVYRDTPDILTLAWNLTYEQCSVVGSIWIAIKYLSLRYHVPYGFEMADASGCTIETVCACEKNDLKRIGYHVGAYM